ncbi:hypothetical protein FOA52_012021 [Chlamydomonas sp. UWO 241]|nr:hypothetical protein FOA52_012021 [Chlamydomonas sp. UWO 241]
MSPSEHHQSAISTGNISVLQNTPLSYPADLWALGCIVFQMLTGSPPFKAGSEYLTFQKVTDRDFAFPDGFPDDARDLVDRLLALEPDERLGAGDMQLLKAHAFFDGVRWGELRAQQAPEFIRPEPRSAEDDALDWELTSLVSNSVEAAGGGHGLFVEPAPGTGDGGGGGGGGVRVVYARNPNAAPASSSDDE